MPGCESQPYAGVSARRRLRNESSAAEVDLGRHSCRESCRCRVRFGAPPGRVAHRAKLGDGLSGASGDQSCTASCGVAFDVLVRFRQQEWRYKKRLPFYKVLPPVSMCDPVRHDFAADLLAAAAGADGPEAGG